MISPLLLCALLCGVFASATPGWGNCSKHFAGGVTPDYLHGHVPVCRGGYYALSYDPEMQNPSWAAYKITKKNVSDKITGRVSGFRKDPDLNSLGITHPSTTNDAYSALWNRGHVAPSAILSATYDSKYETYYTSNIAPQWWQFNQQPWATLEARTLDFIYDSFTDDDSHLFIVTGVGYENRSVGVVKVEDVAIPTFYFKALCDPQAKQSVAFIGNNSEDGGGLMWTYRAVDDVAATSMCGVDINSTLGRTLTSIFQIFPRDGTCGSTSTYNASHWNFNYYTDYGLSGFNCSNLTTEIQNAATPEPTTVAPSTPHPPTPTPTSINPTDSNTPSPTPASTTTTTSPQPPPSSVVTTTETPTTVVTASASSSVAPPTTAVGASQSSTDQPATLPFRFPTNPTGVTDPPTDGGIPYLRGGFRLSGAHFGKLLNDTIQVQTLILALRSDLARLFKCGVRFVRIDSLREGSLVVEYTVTTHSVSVAQADGAVSNSENEGGFSSTRDVYRNSTGGTDDVAVTESTTTEGTARGESTCGRGLSSYDCAIVISVGCGVFGVLLVTGIVLCCLSCRQKNSAHGASATRTQRKTSTNENRYSPPAEEVDESYEGGYDDPYEYADQPDTYYEQQDNPMYEWENRE